MICKARQYCDQMQCGRCGLAWDVNDPEPPRCVPSAASPSESKPALRELGEKYLNAIRRRLDE